VKTRSPKDRDGIPGLECCIGEIKTKCEDPNCLESVVRNEEAGISQGCPGERIVLLLLRYVAMATCSPPPPFVETSVNMTTPIVVPSMINTTHQLMKKKVISMEPTEASSFLDDESTPVRRIKPSKCQSAPESKILCQQPQINNIVGFSGRAES
jgi:hypothetical protein